MSIATGTVTSGTVGNITLKPNNITALTVDLNGHMFFSQGGLQTAAPTVTAGCGTSPTVTGNDSAFVLNVGTGAPGTTCTITFNKAWGTAPHCFTTDQTASATVITSATPGTSTVVLNTPNAWAASAKIDVMCIGHAT